MLAIRRFRASTASGVTSGSGAPQTGAIYDSGEGSGARRSPLPPSSASGMTSGRGARNSTTQSSATKVAAEGLVKTRTTRGGDGA